MKEWSDILNPVDMPWNMIWCVMIPTFFGFLFAIVVASNHNNTLRQRRVRAEERLYTFRRLYFGTLVGVQLVSCLLYYTTVKMTDQQQIILFLGLVILPWLMHNYVPLMRYSRIRLERFAWEDETDQLCRLAARKRAEHTQELLRKGGVS